MQPIPDGDLLDQFTRTGSDAVFGELVRRHVGLVYSVALRQTGQPHQAEEITQAVFIILARKAASVGRRTVLSGWLYHTARLTAANFRRAEFRRIRREQEVFMQSTLDNSAPDLAWPELAPLLDEAMSRLGATDRDAVVLRYFENKPLSEVGAALGMEERAAQKRVQRALEKLRKFFVKRGVASTTTLLAEAMSAHSVQAAPVGLAQSVTIVAAAKGAAAGGSTLTLIKGTLKLMAWTKLKMAVVAGAGLLLAAGTATITIAEIEAHQTYPWQINEGTGDGSILKQFPPQVAIARSKFPGTGYQHRGHVLIVNYGGAVGYKMLGINRSVEQMMATVYDGYGDGQVRTVEPADMPQGSYDFIANLAKDNKEAMQSAIRKKFGLSARHETQERDVILMRLKNPGAPGLIPIHDNIIGGGPLIQGLGRLRVTEETFGLAMDLEDTYFHLPVLDQTGLKDRFKFDLRWPNPDPTGQNLDGLKQAMLEKYGFELVSSREPIDVLVIEKVK